jgi:Tlde1 domain
MTFGTERRNRFGGSDHRCLPPNALPQRVLGGVALAFVATLSAWTVCSFADTGTGQTDFAARWGDRFGAAVTFADRFGRADSRGDSLGVAATFADRFGRADGRGDKLAVSKLPLSHLYASLFDARFSLDHRSGFANEARQRSDDGLVEQPSAPAVTAAIRATSDISGAPTRDRAAKSAASPRQGLTRTAAPRDGGQGTQAPSDSAANKPTIFQSIFAKLFGKPAPVKLAYAATDDAGLSAGRSIAAARYDQWTAVYDISAHVVYMPDGTQLEAHSGFGDRLDDPSHPDEKMRGVTPPNIYDLALRESPFHGVRALRLIPQDEEKVFGRRGLLAHRYMLGPNGDSNGCVSIKNYDAFLQAYLNHDIKRLVVVTRLE